MYKTASKHQLRRAQAAARKKRWRQIKSPTASRFSRELNALSLEMFGKPCKRLSRKELRQISQRVAAAKTAAGDGSLPSAYTARCAKADQTVLKKIEAAQSILARPIRRI